MFTKIRAIHPVHGIEIIDDLYWFEENMVHSFDQNQWVFDQGTGFVDKNGMDVFENDNLENKEFSPSPYDIGQSNDVRVVTRDKNDNNLCLTYNVEDSFYKGRPASGLQLSGQTCSRCEVVGRGV